LQMECIACGLCVDACDNMMTKVGLPKGLIRYDTLAHLIDPIPAKKFKILKPRTFFYATILILVSGLMLRSLILKPTLEISVIPDRNPIFVKLSDGSIRNGYLLKIENKTHERKVFSLKISSPETAILKLQNGDLQHLEIAPDSVGNFKIFTILPLALVEKNEEGHSLVEFVITDDAESKKVSAIFISR
jgi:polyferredoxin